METDLYELRPGVQRSLRTHAYVRYFCNFVLVPQPGLGLIWGGRQVGRLPTHCERLRPDKLLDNH